MDAMEEKEEEYDIFLLLKKQNSENEESKIKRNVEISEEIINQRTAMFLQIIAAGFNDEMSQNDDFRSLLLTLWSNLIHRIAHNLNLQKSSSSLRSIKQILIFPFSLRNFLFCCFPFPPPNVLFSFLISIPRRFFQRLFLNFTLFLFIYFILLSETFKF